MASLKKFPGSKYWYACFRIPTGKLNAAGGPELKRVQRSTGKEDKGLAQQTANSLERVANAIASNHWEQQFANRFLKEMALFGGIEVSQVEETEKFLERWLEAKKRTVAEKTWKNFSGILIDFLEWLGTRKTSPLSDMTPRVIADFRDAELKLGKSGTTVNKALSVLGQAFEEAVNQLAVEKNPTRGLRIKSADKNKQERTSFTFEQFRELVRRTGPGEKSARGREVHSDWQTFVVALGYTGGRQQEVAQLEWGNIKLATRLVGLRRSKNKDVHWMPMHTALHAHLSAIVAKTGEVTLGKFVMPHLSAIPERKISKIFRETILPRVGISQPYAERTADKGVGRKLAAYSVHSLRHSLSTWLNGAGVSEMMRMRLVGHEDEGVSRGYTHTEMVQAAAELEKIPSL